MKFVNRWLKFDKDQTLKDNEGIKFAAIKISGDQERLCTF